MQRYFNFLSKIVRGKNYEFLLKELHRIEFYSLIPNDANRAEDGKKLRELFMDELEYKRQTHPFILEGDILSRNHHDELVRCTVFEMLVALAMRMEGQLCGNEDALSVHECFFLFIRNLDLIWCDNEEYFERPSPEIIRAVIQNFLDRTYTSDGVGGLFPLRDPEKDQRQVEIWYQMSAYLLENFKFW